MPVAEREGSRGQVMRGVCSKCETVTKGKTLGGAWISKCAHPGTDYHGRMMLGGKKTVPVIPESVDRGDLSGGVGATIEAGAAEAAAVADVAEKSIRDPIRGMVAKDEPRDDEKPVEAPLPSAGDPLAYDVRGSLETVAAHARGLAGALAGAQRRIRELEGLVATQAIEGAHLRDRLEDSESEVARLTVELDTVQSHVELLRDLAHRHGARGAELHPHVDDDCEEVADRDMKPENDEPDDDFDPDEILF